MGSLVVKLEQVEVGFGGAVLLRDISFEIRKGEQWAVVGSSGSGKTVLANTLAGNYFFRGRITGDFDDPASFHRSVVLVPQHHRFKDRSNQSDFYYQQRYNAQDALETATVRDDLQAYPEFGSGFSLTELLKLFGLEGLLDEPLIQLSNGENKRLQIVKALLTGHQFLILDQPFIGLDAAGRSLLASVLNQLSERGEQMMLITSVRDIPSSFNRILEMESGRIVWIGDRKLFEQREKKKDIIVKQFPDSMTFEYPDFTYAVRLMNVHVNYGGKQILQDINWEVRKGERWSLSGPNGAGKTTLLSLITGDNPQAYANEIYLFDRRRGTGESIWEIKQKTGLLSPELHLYFDRAATAFQALASGLFDTIGLFRAPSDEQQQLITQWLDFLGLSEFRNIPLNRLPAGAQRMILLGRAMIKTPPLLVLDEPFQGLDDEHIDLVKRLIDHYVETYRATLIFVSHYIEERPLTVDKFIRLERGRII
ncbi:MAG TPA: ATP-binding cassette domain-containing protein [Puia sp.]|nr:ATP-binding cassette domain-containing protein [Puia sp.]